MRMYRGDLPFFSNLFWRLSVLCNAEGLEARVTCLERCESIGRYPLPPLPPMIPHTPPEPPKSALPPEALLILAAVFGGVIGRNLFPRVVRFAYRDDDEPTEPPQPAPEPSDFASVMAMAEAFIAKYAAAKQGTAPSAQNPSTNGAIP